MSFAAVFEKTKADRESADLLPVLELAKARRDGVANKYPRDAFGRFIVPGAQVSVTFDDGAQATAEVKSTSGDKVTVVVGGKSAQAPLSSATVVTIAGVDSQGFDERDREDAAKVAWLSGRWPNAEKLKALRDAQAEQPPESWVLYAKDVGTDVAAPADAVDAPAEPMPADVTFEPDVAPVVA